MQQQVGQGRVQWSRHPQPDMLPLPSIPLVIPISPSPLLPPNSPCCLTPLAPPSQAASKCVDVFQLIRLPPQPLPPALPLHPGFQ